MTQRNFWFPAIIIAGLSWCSLAMATQDKDINDKGCDETGAKNDLLQRILSDIAEKGSVWSQVLQLLVVALVTFLSAWLVSKGAARFFPIVDDQHRGQHDSAGTPSGIKSQAETGNL